MARARGCAKGPSRLEKAATATDFSAMPAKPPAPISPTRAAAVAFLALLGGCATLSPQECRQADWRLIGLRDGERGRPASFIAEHAAACAKSGVTPDGPVWAAGRVEGLRSYCTPLNARSTAARGGSLNPVCEGFDQRALAAAEAEGREIWRREQRLRRIEAAIDAREREIAALSARPDDEAARRRIRALRSDIRRLELDLLMEGRASHMGRPGFIFLPR
ncbi:MAG: DUF2799 domain-containing protein [Rubrimonas sp.]